jgi:hypothetical protein
MSNDQPVQVVHSSGHLKVEVIDLGGIDGKQLDGEVRRAAEAEGRKPFDLEVGPLLRASMLRLGDQECVLLFTIHHILIDGWSLGVFLRELGTLYNAYIKDRPSPLAELSLQYPDYTTWQREELRETFDRQLEYWKRQLAGAPDVLELPTDRPRPAVQSFNGGVKRVEVNARVSHELRRLSHDEGATLFMTILAGFSVLLGRYSGQHDLLVGTTSANRRRADVENLIGFFVNTLVMRMNLYGDPTFRELLARVKEVALEAYAHQDLPFEKLVEELKPARDLSRQPLVQVCINQQSAPSTGFKLSEVKLSPMRIDTGTTKFDLVLEVIPDRSRVRGWLAYNSDIFNESTINGVLNHFYQLLESIVARPDARLSELEMLLDEERGWLEKRSEVEDFEESFSI